MDRESPELLTGMATPMTDPESKRANDNMSLLVICVCCAAVAIFVIGGATWPAAVAVCGLSVMGIGIAFLIIRKR
jgi:uncharacterized membrane protein